MKIRKIIPAVIIFVIMVGIFSATVHAEENTNYFEKSIVGSTGWSTCNQTAKEQPNSNSKNAFTVEAGNAFCNNFPKLIIDYYVTHKIDNNMTTFDV